MTKKAINVGKMDGFVSAQPNSSIGGEAMDYLNGSDLPYYWSLASRFTLFDHFYASSQAGALPNRLVAVSGQDDNLSSNTPPAGGIPVPDRLRPAGPEEHELEVLPAGLQGDGSDHLAADTGAGAGHASL